MLKQYSATYAEIVNACRDRYDHNFKRNARFNEMMRTIKANSQCSYIRELNPKSASGVTKTFYNLHETLGVLDHKYVRTDQAE